MTFICVVTELKGFFNTYTPRDRTDTIHRLQSSHPAVTVKSVPMKHSAGKINGFARLGWCLGERKKNQTPDVVY